MTPTSSRPSSSARSATSGTKRKRAAVGAGGDPVSKAWIGTNDDGERQDIVWAATRNEARGSLSVKLDCPYFEVREVRRYRALDGFTGNLRRWQLANGWHWECQKCYRFAYGKEEGQSDDEGPFAVIDDDDLVFCCQQCLDDYHAYWSAHRTVDAAVREDFKQLHPGVPIVRAWHNEYGGFVDAGAPLNKLVTVWEMVTVTQQFWPNSRIIHRRENTDG